MINATNIFSGVLDLFKNLGNFFVDKVGSTYQPSAVLFFIALGAFFIYVIITIIRTSYSYESRLIKSIDQLNMYFYKNPQITEDNLIEFNNKMKQVPKAVRVQWQLYMLNRDKPASEYLTLENCVERPMKTTTYKHSVKTINIIFDIFIVFLFIVSFAGLVFLMGDGQLGIAFYYAFVMPFLIFVFKSIFMIFLNVRFDATVADLYNNFNVFQRGLDKATTTLPAYIDYEVLFTKKEIKASIPILQDYIEKRERMEKEELARAKDARVEHEKYDFSSVGFDASILLDRIAKECEIFINNKKRLSFEVGQVEEEIRILKINFEEKSKDNLKQQQLCRENLERLRLSAENSIGRVTANTIRKQQEIELKRQEDLETEMRKMQEEFDKQLAELNAKVTNLEDEQVNKKKNIEFAVISEFKTYADKIYAKLEEEAKKNQENEYNKIVEAKNSIAEELKGAYLIIENKNREIEELNDALRDKDAELQSKEQELLVKSEAIERITGEISEKAQELVRTRNAKINNKDVKEPEPIYDENGGYYDDEGYYRFRDGGYYTPDGKYFDKDGNYIPTDTEEYVDDNIEPQYDENGGYFDKDGYYIYKDGSYYDPDGTYHDVNGNKVVNQETDAEKDNKEETERVNSAQAKSKSKSATTKTKKSTVAKSKAKTTKSKSKDNKSKSKSATTKSKKSATSKSKSADTKSKSTAAKSKAATTKSKSTDTKSKSAGAKSKSAGAKSKTIKSKNTKESKSTTKRSSKSKIKKDELEKIDNELVKANKELIENHEELKSQVDSTGDIE